MTTGIPLSGLHRRLISGGTWAILGRIMTAATGFIINALIARIITPKEVGAYFLIVSVVTVATSLAQLGLHVAVVRLIAEAMASAASGKARAIVSKALRIGIISALIVGVLLGVNGELIAKHIFASSEMAAAMWWASAWVVVNTILSILSESFRGFHEYGKATTFSGVMANTIIVAILAGVFLILHQSSLRLVLAVSVVATTTSIALAGYIMRQRLAQLVRHAGTRTRDLLHIGLPLMVTSLSIFLLTQADLWVIGVVGTQEDVAVFGTAVRLCQLLYIPLLISNTVLPPFISELYSQGRNIELEKIIRAMSTIATLPAAVVFLTLVFYGDGILAMMYGDYYKVSYLPLVLIGAGQLVNVWSGSGMMTLVMTGHQRSAMVISIFFGGLIMLGALMAIRPYGIHGVAAVTGSVTAIQALFTLFWVRSKTGLWTHFGMQNMPIVIRKLRSATNFR